MFLFFLSALKIKDSKAKITPPTIYIRFFLVLIFFPNAIVIKENVLLRAGRSVKC